MPGATKRPDARESATRIRSSALRSRRERDLEALRQVEVQAAGARAGIAVPELEAARLAARPAARRAESRAPTGLALRIGDLHAEAHHAPARATQTVTEDRAGAAVRRVQAGEEERGLAGQHVRPAEERVVRGRARRAFGREHGALSGTVRAAFSRSAGVAARAGRPGSVAEAIDGSERRRSAAARPPREARVARGRDRELAADVE